MKGKILLVSALALTACGSTAGSQRDSENTEVGAAQC